MRMKRGGLGSFEPLLGQNFPRRVEGLGATLGSKKLGGQDSPGSHVVLCWQEQWHKVLVGQEEVAAACRSAPAHLFCLTFSFPFTQSNPKGGFAEMGCFCEYEDRGSAFPQTSFVDSKACVPSCPFDAFYIFSQ